MPVVPRITRGLSGGGIGGAKPERRAMAAAQ